MKTKHLLAATILLSSLIASVSVNAQGDPKSNVNLIGMTPDPADFPDSRYRQQNEPACAIRPGDSACIICAYNDYRAVDTDIGFGDAWEGVSQSCDAGDTWLSRLAPGHPLYLPVANRVPAEFAADPRLAAIPGMAIFNFIAGYRDTNVGVLAIQHWLEVNKEDADFYEPGRETYIADEGTSGRFLDKPDMVAVLDGNGTISLDTVMENTDLGTISRDYPTGTLYVAYAAFTGSQSVKVLVKVSHDWGRTFKNQALKLSESQNLVSGISLTAIDNKVLAVWRRKGDGNDPDSIMYSVISNSGKKATKGKVLADVCAFDQPTLTGSETDFNVVTFRTNDFPWTANDGENVYVFYSDRARDPITQACLTDVNGNPNGNPSIVMHHSTLSGNVSWEDHGPIDQTTTPETFQFMPTAFGANGKVQVAWYDTRRDPSDPAALPFVADYDGGSYLVNRTVDVFTTNVTIDNGTVSIPDPVRASQFSILVDEESDTQDPTEYETEASFANKKLFAQGNAPFLGDYIAMAAREYRRNSTDTGWESNASNVPGANEDFFVAWTDNRDVSGVIAQITDTLDYSYDAQTTANAVEPKSGNDGTSQQLVAGKLQDLGPPRDTTQTAEGIDGSDTNTPGFCVPETSRSRDSNIYGSLIKDQARFYAVNPSKPLSGLQRAFPVVITNSEDLDPKTYDLTIIPGVCSGGNCQASFRQHPVFGSPELNEQVTVLAKSSVARTVFVVGDQSPVKVEAHDVATGDLLATIQLANSQLRDPENCLAAQLEDPTVNCSVAENELHNLELQTVDVHLLDQLTLGDELDAVTELVSGDSGIDASILVPWAIAGGCCDGEDPASLGSVIEYAVENLADETTNLQDPADPDPTNANLLNANLLNAALLNANLLNANLLNANLLNANLLNANLLNASPTDLSDLGGEDSPLVTAALNGGCCYIEAEPTVGSIVVWAVNNPDIINANLLNAALLNAALLNANLLNANLLNANLLNANLLNANLLNANLLNANLLNANLLNANLLNANLLNADLLNANLLNPTLVAQAVDGGCCVGTNGDPVPLEAAAAVDVIIYAVGHPEVINASLLNASLLNANLLNANLLNANLLNANLLNANLLNANLLNANLLNANLLNADLLNANLLNANLLNANLLNAALADDPYSVTYDDYTYPITNNGNVATAIDTDITINAPMVTTADGEVMDVIATKLIMWTANATPTVVDCVETVQLNTRVQSIAEPDSSLDIADIDRPFDGQASAVVVPGGTVFVTMRVLGTQAQLKKVRVSGFTASSQAANCFETVNGPQCATQLNEGIEQITFADMEPPVITVPDDITVEATGPSGTVVDYTATAFDSGDANPTLDCMLESGSLFSVGTTTVSCNATDASGNEADTASFDVIVLDRVAPTLSLPATITAEASSSLGAVVTFTATASDDVSTPVVSCDANSGDTFGLGTTTVNCTATETTGSATATGSFDITVLDRVAPTLTLPGNITMEASSSAGAVVTFSATATDNVSTPDVNCDATSGGTFALGTTTVTCTATETTGSESTTGSFDITVLDRVGPTLTVPTNITVEASSSAGAVVTFSATATDNVSTPDVSCDATSGGTFALGTTTVTCTATETTGSESATGSFDIMVLDRVPPTLSLPGNITMEASSSAGAVVTFSATATDSVSTPLVSCDAISGGTFALGTSTVTCTATETTGSASASGSFTVTVIDTTAPALPALPSLSVEATSTAGTLVTWATNATDLVDGDVTMSCAPASGSLFDIGVTPVNCSATDNALNSDSTSFDVTVTDVTDPVIGDVTPPDGFTPIQDYPFELAFDQNTVTVTWPINVTDADPLLVISCSIDGVPLTQNGPNSLMGDQVSASFTASFGVGTTTVICTATDSANQSPTQPLQFDVEVLDVTAPNPPTIPPDDFSQVEATGPGGAAVSWSALFAEDAVDGPLVPVDCAPASGSTFAMGTTTVNCTATDMAGLTSDASSFDVTVVDNTAPLISGLTPIRTAVAGADGTASPDLTDGIVVTDLVDPAPVLSCLPAGPLAFGETTITCTATDASGNPSFANYVFDVTDETGPIITLTGPATVTLEANIDTYVEPGATALDNVDGDVSSNIVITGNVDATTVGTYTRYYDVSDNQGIAAATLSRSVVVQDTIAPVINVPASPLIVGGATSPVSVNYQVSVTDAGNPATVATCVPASGSDFYYGNTPVTCNANDGYNDADSAQFTVTVQFPYDIRIVPPKRSAKAGSTVPLDWQYLDWGTGAAVDSSDLTVEVHWSKMTDGTCLVRDTSMPVGSSGPGDDSGNSGFRYSESGKDWQYSWQTPENKGYHKVSISPPGPDVENAWKCVRLR